MLLSKVQLLAPQNLLEKEEHWKRSKCGYLGRVIFVNFVRRQIVASRPESKTPCKSLPCSAFLNINTTQSIHGFSIDCLVGQDNTPQRPQ